MPNNIKGNFKKEKLLAKVLSEGYCCMHGYIGLCQARGESAKGMAKNIGRHPSAIWSAIRLYKSGTHRCQKLKDCLKPIIEEIEKGP